MSTSKDLQNGQNKKVFTKDELLSYYYLEQEIKQEKEEIAELQARTMRITQSFSDMPRGQASNDANERAVVKLVDKKNALCEKIAVAERTRNEILEYISSINDVKIRLILQYRYLNFLPWPKVAYFVGKNNTPDGVRRKADRFLQKQNN